MPESKESKEPKDAKDAKSADDDTEAVKIDLEMSRGRLVFWTVFGIVVGSLLVWKLGTVGRWVGVVLIAVGIFRAWLLTQTFLNEPGTIIVTETEVSLPRGLSMTRPVKVSRKDVSSVYFLRRSVPWHRTAPVLVVELAAKVSGGTTRAMIFPRDWFASEADQRHIVHALLRGRPGTAVVSDPDSSTSKPTPTPETAAS